MVAEIEASLYFVVPMIFLYSGFDVSAWLEYDPAGLSYFAIHFRSALSDLVNQIATDASSLGDFLYIHLQYSRPFFSLQRNAYCICPQSR